MLTRHCYRVANFNFAVSIPAGIDADTLLPSFIPFKADDVNAGDAPLFEFIAGDEPLAEPIVMLTIEENEKDLGLTTVKKFAGGYRIELRYTPEASLHAAHCNARFTAVKANIDWNDVYAGNALCSLLRIVFAQSILLHKAVSIHAAAVTLSGKAYLFMGKSGTGKSTHAAMWQKCFGKCTLLNDDNPVLRIIDGVLIAFGTPWSGKTPCYVNEAYPVGGIVRLSQATVNRFSLKSDVDGFIALLPGCSVLHSDSNLYGNMCDTLTEICESTLVGALECLPDVNAAMHCADSLNVNINDILSE